MKQFFKFMFASLLGFFIGLFILILIFAGIIAAAVSMGDKEVKVADKSVLKMSLEMPIPDRAPENPFANFSPASFEANTVLGLDQILESIGNAAKDDRIEGIYLDISAIPSYMATIEEIRNALIDFRESGKFIIAYGEMADQKAYYLASVADRIYLNPEGMMLFKGINGSVTFIKGMLDKLGIEAQVIRHGKFKAAVEPLIQEEMSAANEEQVLTYISSLWNHMLQGIAEERGISVEQLNAYADSLGLTFVDDAIAAGMIDGTRHQSEFLQELADSAGVAEIKDLETISLSKYVKAEVNDDDDPVSRDKIAVIFAEGDIVTGKGEDGSIGSDKFAKLLRKARMDEDVKAIVLRVNSPGGDGLASDIILEELLLAKAEKPVVASYGGVAASGGYYISCGADTILASPNTITGSIGVFGVFPNMQELLNDKLGITFDHVMTNAHADFMDLSRPMNAMEEQVLTRFVEDFYQTFIGRVAEGRGMTPEAVDSIGQGRVWAGSDALRLGLIDGFGGLQDAIETAAGMAGLDAYRVKKYPELKDPFEKIMDAFGGSARAWLLQRELGDLYQAYLKAKRLKDMDGVQARMDYDISVN